MHKKVFNILPVPQLCLPCLYRIFNDIRKIGFEILIAKNSAQACQLYQDEKDNIDLVVLDMIMPDENGTNTYKQLKV